MNIRVKIRGHVSAGEYLRCVYQQHGALGVAALLDEMDDALVRLEENGYSKLRELGAAVKANAGASRFVEKLHAAIHVRPLP